MRAISDFGWLSAAAVFVACGCSADAEVPCSASNEVMQLAAQVENLVEALASARSEVDSLRERLTAREFGRYAWVAMKPGLMDSSELLTTRMSSVSGELRMVILDKGARQGLRPGQKFAVVRAGRTIAEIETVDVREKIAGAVIVRVETGVLPETSDRLLEIAVLTK